MEPLTTVASTIFSIVAIEALKQAGRNIASTTLGKMNEFIRSLKLKSPSTAEALEKSSAQSLDYDRVIQEVDAVAKNSPEIARAMEQFVEEVKKDRNPELKSLIVQNLRSQQSRPEQGSVVNYGKVAEDIHNFFQGGVFIQPTFQ